MVENRSSVQGEEAADKAQGNEDISSIRAAAIHVVSSVLKKVMLFLSTRSNQRLHIHRDSLSTSSVPVAQEVKRWNTSIPKSFHVSDQSHSIAADLKVKESRCKGIRSNLHFPILPSDFERRGLCWNRPRNCHEKSVTMLLPLIGSSAGALERTKVHLKSNSETGYWENKLEVDI